MNTTTIKTFIKYLILLMALFFIITYFKSHQKDLSLFFQLSPTAITKLFILSFSIMLLYSYKVLLIYKSLELKISYLNWLSIFSISRFLNLHFMQGANIYRSVILKKDYNFPYTQSIGLISAYVWLETITILTFSIIVISATAFTENFSIFFKLIVGLILLYSSPLILDILIRINKNSRHQYRNNQSIPNQASKYLSALQSFTHHLLAIIKNRPLILNYFYISFITFVMYIVSVNICFTTLNNPLSLGDTTLFTAMLILSRIINIIPGNIGIAEIGCGFLAKILGSNISLGIIISTIFRVLNYCATVLLIIPFLKPFFQYRKEAH